MKILFTLLSIEVKSDLYVNSTKRLISEILNLTNHDILLSTNKPEKFESLKNDRLIVRNNISENSILSYGNEFNYNLKYHCFDNLPDGYDCVIYLDCDIKLNDWSDKSENFITNLFKDSDFIADRLNCVLGDVVNEVKKGNQPLFIHKVISYDILERYSLNDDIMKSQLPSEHFLIFKFDKLKLDKFKEKWKEFNDYLQNKNGFNGCWGDGFEIGIAARYAGFHKTNSIGSHYWDNVLGFKFNGNKF